jgi:hypothetical protein
MPERLVDPASRAVVYVRTPDEQKMADMQKELNDLKKIVMSQQNTKKK